MCVCVCGCTSAFTKQQDDSTLNQLTIPLGRLSLHIAQLVRLSAHIVLVHNCRSVAKSYRYSKCRRIKPRYKESKRVVTNK